MQYNPRHRRRHTHRPQLMNVASHPARTYRYTVSSSVYKSADGCSSSVHNRSLRRCVDGPLVPNKRCEISISNRSTHVQGGRLQVFRASVSTLQYRMTGPAQYRGTIVKYRHAWCLDPTSSYLDSALLRRSSLFLLRVVFVISPQSLKTSQPRSCRHRRSARHGSDLFSARRNG